MTIAWLNQWQGLVVGLSFGQPVDDGGSVWTLVVTHISCVRLYTAETVHLTWSSACWDLRPDLKLGSSHCNVCHQSTPREIRVPIGLLILHSFSRAAVQAVMTTRFTCFYNGKNSFHIIPMLYFVMFYQKWNRKI